ncbi:MAG: sigma 54-interacting transcriptional regulator [Nannocystaceae bacterium]
MVVDLSSTTVATAYGSAEPGGSANAVQLVVVEGPDMGRTIDLGEQAIVVGTDAGCELTLTDDRVSGRHLQLTPQAGQATIALTDLNSRNGVFVAGSQVQAGQVQVGQPILIGRSYLRVVPRPQPLTVQPTQARRFGEMVGESLVMREVFAVLELAASSDVTVLLEGETGTGKELAARAIHTASARRVGPFVPLDCGALPENLLESELFGHQRGAFTGAVKSREGAFVRANGGTIFLDELDSVPMHVQSRLLRVLEARNVRPLGADSEVALDVRVVAATRRPLLARVQAGGFRPDLYYRLGVICVELAPLRRRREDLPRLVAELLRVRGFSQCTPSQVSGPNLDRLIAHDWPGNVRELRNVIDRTLALSPTATAFDQLRLSVPGGAGGENHLRVRTDLAYSEAKKQLLEVFEFRYLSDLLARCQGNLSAAAREAKVDRKHLKTLLRRHGLLSS